MATSTCSWAAASSPGRYGFDPLSTLLQNDGRGRFTDVTEKLAPALARIGMVTDAVWTDLTGDGRLDLVVVGEWMPITVMRNADGGKLEKMEVRGLEKSEGWWNRIVAGDFNRDGRTDFIIGNLGLNTRLRASDTEPVTMYVKDFDKNGFSEQIVSCYMEGTSYPIVLRDDLIKTLPYLKSRYLAYKDYARQTVTDIFSPEDLSGAVLKQARTFATVMARNDGNGAFTLVPLPIEAQTTADLRHSRRGLRSRRRARCAARRQLRRREAGDRPDGRGIRRLPSWRREGRVHRPAVRSRAASSFLARRATFSVYALAKGSCTWSLETTTGHWYFALRRAGGLHAGK